MTVTKIFHAYSTKESSLGWHIDAHIKEITSWHMILSMDSLWTYSYLLWCPWIQVHRLDFGNVDAEVSVYTRTPDTEEYAQIPWCPSRTCNRQHDLIKMHFTQLLYIWLMDKIMLQPYTLRDYPSECTLAIHVILRGMGVCFSGVITLPNFVKRVRHFMQESRFV